MISINGGVLTQEVTGVQRYAIEILTALSGIYLEKNNSLDQIKLIGVGKNNKNEINSLIETISTPDVTRPIWAQMVLPFFAQGCLISLGNIGPLAYKNQILCIHDANTYIVPESYSKRFRIYYKILLPLIARRVRHLVTVSEFSRSMLINYDIAGGREIHVIPNGHEHILRWDESKSCLADDKRLALPFVLLIGSRARHKNTAIVESIAKELQGIGLNLVIVGRVGKHYQQIEISESNSVIYLGSVSDDDLSYLYKRALCLAFPSITEGFGLPALEAMALGCPVISSDVASMPEVCGEAALYADPHDKNTWLAQIHKIAQDKNLRRNLVESGIKRSHHFSWKKSAQQYIDLLNC